METRAASRTVTRPSPELAGARSTPPKRGLGGGGFWGFQFSVFGGEPQVIGHCFGARVLFAGRR